MLHKLSNHPLHRFLYPFSITQSGHEEAPLHKAGNQAVT